MSQWQKAIHGVLARPAAIALSAAANTPSSPPSSNAASKLSKHRLKAMGRELQGQARGYIGSGNGDWGGQERNPQPQS